MVKGSPLCLNPLQVTDGFHVVGQHSTDGYGRFLDFSSTVLAAGGITQKVRAAFQFWMESSVSTSL